MFLEVEEGRDEDVTALEMTINDGMAWYWTRWHLANAAITELMPTLNRMPEGAELGEYFSLKDFTLFYIMDRQYNILKGVPEQAEAIGINTPEVFNND